MDQIKVSIDILKNDASGADTIMELKGRNLNDLASILVAFRGEDVYYVISPEKPE